MWPDRTHKTALTLCLVLSLFILMACCSTACMSNEDLYTWLDTGTPQRCEVPLWLAVFVSEYR